MNKHNLERFLKPPEGAHASAFLMVFPRITGIGQSEIEQHFAISNLEEASAYLRHEELGRGLIGITTKLLEIPSNNALEIFDPPEVSLLHACMTLFAQVKEAPSCFQNIIEKFFDGIYDGETLDILSDIEALEIAEKHGVKPENIITFIFDPDKPSDEQLQSFKEMFAKRTGLELDLEQNKTENE